MSFFLPQECKEANEDIKNLDDDYYTIMTLDNIWHHFSDCFTFEMSQLEIEFIKKDFQKRMTSRDGLLTP